MVYRLVKDQGGNYVAVGEDGSRRTVPPSVLDRAQPLRVINEQGVSPMERFIVKNFAANKDSAKAFLRSHGYEVRDYGDHPLKWQFAVRRGGSTDPWKVVDPDGLDAQDLTDMAGDAVQGALTGIATTLGLGAGGPAGGAAAGAAAGAGLEGIRQGIGSALGVPNNTDVSQIGIQGAVGGAYPLAEAGLGKLAEAAAPRIGRAALETGAKIAGVRSSPRLSPTEALRTFASTPRGQAPAFEEVAERMYDVLQNPKYGLFKMKFAPAEALESDLADAVGGKKLTVDANSIPSLMENIIAQTDTEAGLVQTPEAARGELRSGGTLRNQVKKLYSLLDGYRRSAGDAPWTDLPVDVAYKMKQDLQRIARDADVYEGLPVTDDFSAVARDTAAIMRKKVIDKMEGSGYTKFAENQKSLEDLTNARADLLKALKSPATTEQFIRRVYGSTNASAYHAIQEVERQFGVKLLPQIKAAQAAMQVVPRGEEANTLGFLPRIAATGAPVLAGTLGYLQGGPVGAAAGLAITSRGSVVTATRLGVKATELAAAGARKLAPAVPAISLAARSAGITTLQQSARQIGKGVARSDNKKRKANLL